MSQKKYDPKTNAPNRKRFSPTDRLMVYQLALQGGSGVPRAIDTHKLLTGKPKNHAKKKAGSSKEQKGKGWFK